jgi:hypothetical protein
MLEALPSREADYYKVESNCIDYTGKSQTMLDEIHARYAFVGGEYTEYIKYFHRADLPSSLWTWRQLSEVKAIGGFSVVAKKDNVKQRKLLMVCAFNFLLENVERRSQLGLDGAGAMTRLSASSGQYAAASCDQSNSFTYVKVPSWMTYFQGTPPVPALAVWTLLPLELRNRIHKHTMVSACYNRLAMGCSHAVHILMAINMRIIGMALLSFKPYALAPDHETFEDGAEAAALICPPPEDGVRDELEDLTGCSDDEWRLRQQARASGADFAAGFSVNDWFDACEQARNSEHRIFTVMLMFSGERRSGDIHDWVEQMAKYHNLPTLI